MGNYTKQHMDSKSPPKDTQSRRRASVLSSQLNPLHTFPLIACEHAVMPTCTFPLHISEPAQQELIEQSLQEGVPEALRELVPSVCRGVLAIVPSTHGFRKGRLGTLVGITTVDDRSPAVLTAETIGLVGFKVEEQWIDPIPADGPYSADGALVAGAVVSGRVVLMGDARMTEAQCAECEQALGKLEASATDLAEIISVVRETNTKSAMVNSIMEQMGPMSWDSTTDLRSQMHLRKRRTAQQLDGLWTRYSRQQRCRRRFWDLANALPLSTKQRMELVAASVTLVTRIEQAQQMVSQLLHKVELDVVPLSNDEIN